MTGDMWRSLGEAVAQLSAGDTTALLVRSEGDVFVAGSDLRELSNRTPADSLRADAQRALMNLADAPFVTVAVVDGAAIGGGFELALSCDMRLASGAAMFSCPELQYGMVPSAGATQRLPGIVGDGTAADIILTGRSVDAAEAETIGLVSRVLEAAELLPAARELARELSSRDSIAIQGVLAALRLARSGSDGGFAAERLAQATCFATRPAIPSIGPGKHTTR